MPDKQWHKQALIFKDLLSLEYSPVSVSISKEEKAQAQGKKIRICKAILDAARGSAFCISKINNLCLGASWHLGFQKIDERGLGLIKKFIVEGEKLVCSYRALDVLLDQMEQPQDNSDASFLLAPMENSGFTPQLIIFIVNAEAACRLLTLATFSDGLMPKIKIGGPTCRLSIIYPLSSGQINLSFYDFTARRLSKIDKDKLIVSIPYNKIQHMIESIDKCCAGKAKMEYPHGFRRLFKTQ